MSQFEFIAQRVYATSGIHLKKGKENLVKTRLTRRLRELEIETVDDYLALFETDHNRSEHHTLVDLLTTNKTGFFREKKHFEFLKRLIVTELETKRKLRFWSAGCSSGEEPYSLAILIQEILPHIKAKDIRILATDISKEMLEKARSASYDHKHLEGVSPELVTRYFSQAVEERRTCYTLNEQVKNLVWLAHLNLMESWPMKEGFDVIMCRNVMIYFDSPTREHLINRFYDLLNSGGHLLVGHSESLVAVTHRFRYVHPAVYVKD